MPGICYLRYFDEIVEKVSEDAHSFLYLTGGTLGGLLVGNGRYDQRWVKLFESVTEPDKITVSSTDIPIDSWGGDHKLKKAGSSNPKDPSRILPLWATSYQYYLVTSHLILAMIYAGCLGSIFMHLKVLSNYYSIRGGSNYFWIRWQCYIHDGRFFEILLLVYFALFQISNFLDNGVLFLFLEGFDDIFDFIDGDDIQVGVNFEGGIQVTDELFSIVSFLENVFSQI